MKEINRIKKHLIVPMLMIALCVRCSGPAKTPMTVAKAENNTILFANDDIDKAFADAKAENKPIFMDVYTSWCGWCKKLDRGTYTDPSVAEYMNKNFVLLKMNAEVGKGPQVAAKYSVYGYPRMLFLDSAGRVIYDLEGYCDAPTLLKAAKKAMAYYNKN